jgi:hypothetical protein
MWEIGFFPVLDVECSQHDAMLPCHALFCRLLAQRKVSLGDMVSLIGTACPPTISFFPLHANLELTRNSSSRTLVITVSSSALYHFHSAFTSYSSIRDHSHSNPSFELCARLVHSA